MTDSNSRQGKIAHIALDIGGVLLADYWQSVLLDHNVGLWRQLGIPYARVKAVGDELWTDYSLRRSSEEEYWDDFEAALGRRPTAAQIRLAEDAIWTETELHLIVDLCADRSLDLYIVTENTEFFLRRQRELLPALRTIPDAHVISSHKAGLGKQSPSRSLYNVLADRCPPSATLVVDDAALNLAAAQRISFQTLRYVGPPRPGFGLLASLRPALEEAA
jgi:FMN phosphatase YigB (HAD superfamily)